MTPEAKAKRWDEIVAIGKARVIASNTFDLASLVSMDAVRLMRAAGQGDSDEAIRAALDVVRRVDELLKHYDLDVCIELLKDRNERRGLTE